MAFSNVQIAWAKSITNHIYNLFYTLFNSGKLGIYFFMWTIFAIICIMWLWIRKKYSESILGIIFMLIPLSSGLTSFLRYIIGSFVYFLSFSDMVITLNK